MHRECLGLIALVALACTAENAAWKESFPPHKIAGNIYYVGTADLACFLLTTPQGHILINTGLADSTPLIRASMKKLGFRLEDVKVLLNMQAHFDHVAAMHEIQRISGAAVYATEQDAPALEDGGRSDPSMGPRNWFAPVKVDRKLKDGDVVKLGGTELTVILTPGHTKGSVSYATTVVDGGQKRTFLFANMETVVMPLIGNTKYPQIVSDYERSFEKQKKLPPDIWVAAHASQYRMQEKLKAGSFLDPAGYQAAIEHYAKLFQQQLEKEREQAAGVQ